MGSVREIEPAGHHDHVVGHLARLALGRLEGDRALRVVDLGHRSVEDVHLGQDAPQRRHHVARRQVARGGLGKERLVGHVGLGVDDGDADFSAAQLAVEFALQPQRRVEADVPAADDQNVLVHPEAPSLVECL